METLTTQNLTLLLVYQHVKNCKMKELQNQLFKLGVKAGIDLEGVDYNISVEEVIQANRDCQEKSVTQINDQQTTTLVYDYLQRKGYLDVAEELATHCNVKLHMVKLSTDLETIFQSKGMHLIPQNDEKRKRKTGARRGLTEGVGTDQVKEVTQPQGKSVAFTSGQQTISLVVHDYLTRNGHHDVAEELATYCNLEQNNKVNLSTDLETIFGALSRSLPVEARAETRHHLTMEEGADADANRLRMEVEGKEVEVEAGEETSATSSSAISKRVPETRRPVDGTAAVEPVTKGPRKSLATSGGFPGPEVEAFAYLPGKGMHTIPQTDEKTKGKIATQRRFCVAGVDWR